MPPPQGPFVVTSKTPVAIKFVNVFEEDKDFEFSVDSHWFIIKETNATIKAKEVCTSIKCNLFSILKGCVFFRALLYK